MIPNLTSGDFAPPLNAEIGDRRKDKLHLAVGRAIHQWEVVEHHLGSLFAGLLGTAIPVGALRAYGVMTAFQLRQQILMHAAATLFHYRPNEALHSKFKKIVKDIGDRASQRRNEVAHGLVVGEHRHDRVHYFLVPPFHSAKFRDFNIEPNYKYTSREIEQFTQKYRSLAGIVHHLGIEIVAWCATSPKSPPQPYQSQNQQDPSPDVCQGEL